MREQAETAKVRWLVAGFGAVGVVTALLLLFRAPIPPAAIVRPAIPDPKRATVLVAKPDDSNKLLKEEAELRDLRPLFLPTDKNAALPEPRIEPGRTFLDNETLKLTFSDAEAQVSRDLPPLAAIAGKPAAEARPLDALSAVETPIVLDGFGRRTSKIEPMEPRAAFIEVVELKSGAKLFSEALPAAARPPGDKAWSPVEFTATVDAVGLVGLPMVVEGSRVNEVDDHFKNYLARVWRIGERLAPGFYRITVAP